MARTIRLHPDRWTRRGEAEGVAGGHPVVVWQGIPGEDAEVKVVVQGRNQDYALWERAERPHKHRVDPPCERYSACGGCPLMHLDQDGQRKTREHLVKEAFAAAGLEATLSAWHDSPEGVADFRHVIKLGVGLSDRGHLRVGAWGRRDRHIVPIPECTVAHPALRHAMKAVAHHVIDLKLYPFDPETDRGVLRAIVLRRSHTTGGILVTLVAGRRARALRDLADRISEQVSEVVGVWVHVNQDEGNALFTVDEEGEIGVSGLLGAETLDEVLNGVTYRVGPVDFFQTNPAMAEVLYRRVAERLRAGAEDTVVDLYCGVGGYALQVAGQVAFTLGVEERLGAVLRARESAKANGLEAEFVAGRVDEQLPALAKRLGSTRPLVAVNPARRGLEDGVIDGIAALKPRRVAYVSCNPRALARDLARFVEHGFVVGDVELFDMFPNTPHVEALVVLEAPDADAPAGRPPRRRVVRAG